MNLRVAAINNLPRIGPRFGRGGTIAQAGARQRARRRAGESPEPAESGPHSRPGPPRAGQGSLRLGSARHRRGCRAHGRRARGGPTSRGARPTPRPSRRTRARPALALRSAEPAARVPAPSWLGPLRCRRCCQPGSAGAGSLRADAGPRGRGGARGGAARRAWAALATAVNWGRWRGRGVVTLQLCQFYVGLDLIYLTGTLVNFVSFQMRKLALSSRMCDQ